MIALFNFNSYLGGGETVFTRWAEYLKSNNIDYRLFYSSGSFIDNELKRLRIDKTRLCPYCGNTNYYYQNKKERIKYIDWICTQLNGYDNVKMVSFCMRDLYTLVDVAKSNSNFTITHLILHDEDNLYACQTLTDKLIQLCGGRRRFSNKKLLGFNNRLFRVLIDVGGLIAEKMTTKIVLSQYNIQIGDDIIVPPPMCVFKEQKPSVVNNGKIIWMGRIVDFKLPAICAMLDFVIQHKKYSLTIVGDGETEYLNRYIDEHGGNCDNIFFKGTVPYNEIGQIIKQHSIGYACGTSIVEIGKYGLPVITALASPTHTLFERSICGGVYNNKYKGNEGNNLFIGETENDQPTIAETMDLIESDFENAAKQSYQAMKEDFDLIRNFEKYHHIVDNAKRIDYKDIKVPYSPMLKKLLFDVSDNIDFHSFNNIWLWIKKNNYNH